MSYRHVMHGGLIENIMLNSDVIVTKLELKLCAYDFYYCQHSCLKATSQAGWSKLLNQTEPRCQQTHCVAASATGVRNSNEHNSTSLQGEGQI